MMLVLRAADGILSSVPLPLACMGLQSHALHFKSILWDSQRKKERRVERLSFPTARFTLCAERMCKFMIGHVIFLHTSLLVC